MAEAKGATPIKLLVAITLVAVAAAAMGCLTGDSGGGPAAEAGDSGGGEINPNPAGADPAAAVESKETEAVIKKIVEMPWDKVAADMGNGQGLGGIIHLVKEPNVLYLAVSDSGDAEFGMIAFRKEDWHNKRLEFEFGGATVTKHAFGRRSLEFSSKHGSSEIYYLYNVPIGPKGLSSPGDGKYVLVCLE